ncbi:MAG: DUF2283 domain-containing protein [Candidatus Portnoybacteria bacterium]|nr:DUF2283 domain-containing protein [Candidatus Portnoybacteria bacterium]
MKIVYDKKQDILYIEFKDTTVTTKRLDEDVALDYDESGTLAGIEVLSASERLHFDRKQPKIELHQILASARG